MAGLLALILPAEARMYARMDEHHDLITLANQDRSKWDRQRTGGGVALLHPALASRPPGRFAPMAAISAVHDKSASGLDTD